jgi:hypothetical protein
VNLVIWDLESQSIWRSGDLVNFPWSIGAAGFSPPSSAGEASATGRRGFLDRQIFRRSEIPDRKIRRFR